MKGVKGKLLKKLKSIKPVGYLKPDRVLQAFAIDGFVDSCPKTPDLRKEPQMARKESEPEINRENRVVMIQEPEIIDVTELMRDLEDDDEEEMSSDEGVEDKENIRPLLKGNTAVLCEENLGVPKTLEQGSCRKAETPLSEIDISSFRRPDLNSCSLFDPNLLVAFEQAVKEHMKTSEAERQARIEQEKLQQSRDETEWSARLSEQENEPPHKTRRIDDAEAMEDDPTLGFEEKCPPGGDGSVILYTTTLTGIRKTFEDCNRVRFLLESFRVLFFERDVSMHMEYKEELWKILDGKAVPPKLFIKGRYIGGAEEVLTLHEQGKLKLLFDGIPVDRSDGPCEACAGVRFVLCFRCSGSHRIISSDGLSSQCPTCNENGLIICPYCC